jgi:hypothetical protein
MLPDICLLETFHFYVDAQWTEWHTLVHVCRKWRDIVFGSPRRLNLRLLCEASTPVREMLDIWPFLHIVVRIVDSLCDYGRLWRNRVKQIHMDDIAEVLLVHSDRICQMHFWTTEYLGEVWDAMMQPFPALTYLDLHNGENALVLSDSFLGGSAPLLRSFILNRVPFPGAPNLLLSATHLVHLELEDIPQSGYFSSNTIVTTLSTLTRLEYLVIKFKSYHSLTGRKAYVRLCWHALFSPFSLVFTSVGLTNTWRTSWSGWMPLYLKT